MSFGVIPETFEEFERQFGRERIVAAAAECGIRASSPQARLSDDQRRVLFQRLIGQSPGSTTESRQALRPDPTSDSRNPTGATALAPVSSAVAASIDTNRLLRQIHEEQRARANLEQAFRAQRALSESLTLQVTERDLELQRISLVEPKLRGEIAALSERIQSQQRMEDENERLRAELKSQSSVIAASRRSQTAEARANALRAEVTALRRKADKAEKLHFEGVRQRTQIADQKAQIDDLKARLRAARSDLPPKVTTTERNRQMEAANQTIATLKKKLDEVTRTGQTQVPAAMDVFSDPRIRAWAQKQGRAGRRFVPPKIVAVAGEGPMPSNALECLLEGRGIEVVPVGDPRASVLIVGRDHWEVDQIEEQIKARSGEDLFVHSQEMFLTTLLVGADPFSSGLTGRADPKLMRAFADGHPALQCCIEEGFLWPSIPTADIARLLDVAIEAIEESPLHHMGYRVGKTDGVAERKRHDILARAFAGELPKIGSRDYMKGWGKPGTRRRLRRIATAIDWYIVQAMGRQTKRGHDMSVAVADWTADLNWLHEEIYEAWMHFRWPDTRVRGARLSFVRAGAARPRAKRPTHQRTPSQPDYRRVVRFK
jgi:hypothetical protein